MKRKITLAFALAGSFLLFPCCDNDDAPPPPTPVTVTGFSPTYGLEGDLVTITGTNFSSMTAENIVKFGDLTANIQESSTTELVVSVPPGASSGKITVQSKNPIGTSTNEFEVIRQIPLDGLIAFYPAFGELTDESGNNHDFNVNPTEKEPTYSTDRFGKANQACQFDGIDDYRFAQSVSIKHPLTTGFWIRYDQDDEGGLVGTSVGTSTGLAISLYDDGMLAVEVDDNVLYQIEGVLPASSNGQWIFIAIAFDGPNLKLYVNGVLKKDYSGAANSITDTNVLKIGQVPGGAGYYSGELDDIAVYNRVLTDNEITALFKQTISKYKSLD